MPRPRSVSFLAAVLAVIGAFNLLGAVNGLRGYTELGQLPLSLPPVYLIARSLLWAVVFVWLAVGLWRLKESARRGALAAATVYVLQSWLERLLLGRSDYARVSIPFHLVLHGLSLSYLWLTLLRRSVRRSFSA